jgi:murein DD-endopeptidase MepM/ murein hydrolase activator NlpD
MSKVKFLYNTETCRYEPVRFSGRQVFLNVVQFFAAALIIASGLIIFYNKHFVSIEESYLMAQNEELRLKWSLLNHDLKANREKLSNIQTHDDRIYRVILDSEPVPATVRQAGIGGSDRYKSLRAERLINESMIISTYRLADVLKRQLYVQTKSFDELATLEREKEKKWAARPAIQPIHNKELTRLASGFGMRDHPTLGEFMMHKGLDFTAEKGTPIYATGDGEVINASYSDTYGNVVYIDHGFGYETRYAHLTKFNIKDGDKVKRGDCIGYVGNTGRSVAPHLHYEVLVNGVHVNPIHYFHQDLTNKEYEELINLSNRAIVPLDSH